MAGTKYEWIAFMRLFRRYYNCSCSELFVILGKNALHIEGKKISDDDIESLLDIENHEEAAYAVKYLMKKYS